MNTEMLDEILKGRSMEPLLMGDVESKQLIYSCLRILEEMEKRTGVVPTAWEEDLEAAYIFQMGECGDLPGFENPWFREIFEHVQISRYEDLVNVVGFAQCAYLNAQGEVSDYPVKDLLSLDAMFTNRDQLAEYLLSQGMEAGIVCKLVEYVRRGRYAVQARKAKLDPTREAFAEQELYETLLYEAKVPNKVRSYLERIAYLPQGIPVKLEALGAWKCAWYKARYAELYREVIQEMEKSSL